MLNFGDVAFAPFVFQKQQQAAENSSGENDSCRCQKHLPAEKKQTFVAGRIHGGKNIPEFTDIMTDVQKAVLGH